MVFIPWLAEVKRTCWLAWVDSLFELNLLGQNQFAAMRNSQGVGFALVQDLDLPITAKELLTGEASTIGFFQGGSSFSR